MTTYRTCAVPLCRNTTAKCPDKLFIHVPKCPKRRKQWLQLARRDKKFTSDKSTIFYCEDHFGLPNDMENYFQYSIMGSVRKIRMKPDCLPSKFECQPDRLKRTAPPQPRSAVSKRQRMNIIKEMFSKETEIPTSGMTSGSYMHRFPNPEKRFQLFKKWMKVVGDKMKETNPLKIYKSKRICQHHFTPEQTVACHRLLYNSVPCVNLNGRVTLSSGILVQIEHNYSFSVAYEKTDCSSQQSSKSVQSCHEGQRKRAANTTSTSPLTKKQRLMHTSETTAIEDIAVPSTNGAVDDYLLYSAYDESESVCTPLPDDPNRAQSTEEPAHLIGLSSLHDVLNKRPRREAIFSWQKRDKDILYPSEDTDVLVCPSVRKDEELGDLSLYDEDPPAAGRDSNLDKHAEYRCNVCQKEIVGFRYACVQCADWDLCGACEARAEHAAHYVLRVPSPRPYNEIQAVLAAIREQLLSQDLFLSEQIISVKLEPEEEAEAALPEPAAGLDPLQQRLSDSEDDHVNASGHSSPRGKRRRPRCSDADETSEALISNLANITNGQPDRLTSPANNQKVSNKSGRKRAKHNTSPVNPIEIDSDDAEVLNSTRHLTDHQPIDELRNTDAVELTEETATEKDAFNIDPIYTGVKKIGESNLEDNDQALLRVPLDTNDAALIQINEIDSDDTEVLNSISHRTDDQPIDDFQNTGDVTATEQIATENVSFDIDPIFIYTGVGKVGKFRESNLEHNNQVLLRVPADTNVAALSQALHSQAYVVMQSLASG